MDVGSYNDTHLARIFLFHKNDPYFLLRGAVGNTFVHKVLSFFYKTQIILLNEKPHTECSQVAPLRMGKKCDFETCEKLIFVFVYQL